MRKPSGRHVDLLASDGDVSLSAFGFDLLSLFAFLVELERACGMKFDETLLGDEQLRTIRSMASLIRQRDPFARPGVSE